MREGAKWGQEAAFEPRDSQQRQQPLNWDTQADRTLQLLRPAGTITHFTLLLANTPHFQALRLLTVLNPVSAPPPVPSPAPPPRLLAKATATVPLPFPTMTKASIYQQRQRRSTSSHHRGRLG